MVAFVFIETYPMTTELFFWKRCILAQYWYVDKIRIDWDGLLPELVMLTMELQVPMI